MNKKKFVWGIVILFLLVSIGLYRTLFYVDKQMIEQGEILTEAELDTKTSEPLRGVGTLESLVAEGRPLECTIIYNAPEYEEDIEGSYFIADDSVRGDFIVPSEEFEGDILSSIIVHDEKLYLWSEIEGKKYGVTTDAGDTEATDTQEAVPSDVNVRYSCMSWNNVDRSVFIPPVDIIFQDSNEVTGEFGTIYEEEGEF